MARTLVSGATGNVGRYVVGELQARGASVRAFVRDPAKATDIFGDDIDVAVGDFADSASLARAMDGVDQVFLTSASQPLEVRDETAVIDAAARAGVRRIVKLSTVGAAVGSSLAFADWHGRIEQHLADSGMTAVVLRSSFYMHNLFANADAVRHTGKLFAPADDARIAMIDRRDVAAAAAVLLTDERHHEPMYTISGPAAIMYRDVAASLSAATGHNIMFVHIPDEAAHAALRDSGACPRRRVINHGSEGTLMADRCRAEPRSTPGPAATDRRA